MAPKRKTTLGFEYGASKLDVDDGRFGEINHENCESFVHWVTTTVLDLSGRIKIVKYDFHKVVSLSAFRTLLVKGTVFRLDRAVYVCMSASVLVFLVAFFCMYYFGENSSAQEAVAPIGEISGKVQRYCPFLFGLYASLVLGRWWHVRTKAIGQIKDHCINLSGLLASLASRIVLRDEDWKTCEQIHSTIVRYGIASLSCITMESRGGNDQVEMTKLVDQGILTSDEVALLRGISTRATALWCWMTAMSSEMMEMLRVAAPIHNNVYQEIRMGILGITAVHEYIRTQLPFPYVHMIILLVNVNNLIMALESGLRCGMAAWTDDHTTVFCEVLKGMTVPLMYQGLLQITVFLSDPLGDDIIDFPIIEYQLEMSEICFSQLGVRRLYEKRNKAGLSPLPNAHIETSLFAKDSSQAAEPAACTGPTVPEDPDRLERKMAALCAGIDSLVGSVNTLDSKISQGWRPAEIIGALALDAPANALDAPAPAPDSLSGPSSWGVKEAGIAAKCASFGGERDLCK